LLIKLSEKFRAWSTDWLATLSGLQAADFAYRLRAGNYRILFDVVGDRIIVQRIKKRGEAYD
jgi:mRNA-degrading endonuclease RelE of RelBE toxin-antitoxin system